MLPGQWPNQIVKNLFVLINVKENGRSVGMSRCNCGRAWEEAFNILGFNSENSELQKALAEIMQGEVFVILLAGLGKSVMLSMSSIVV